jgi:hypothetical protein
VVGENEWLPGIETPNKNKNARKALAGRWRGDARGTAKGAWLPKRRSGRFLGAVAGLLDANAVFKARKRGHGPRDVICLSEARVGQRHKSRIIVPAWPRMMSGTATQKIQMLISL